VGSSTAAQGSTANTNRSKRSRPQELQETGEGSRKRNHQEVGTTASQAVGEQEPVYRGFTVGRDEVSGSASAPAPKEGEPVPNYGQSNVNMLLRPTGLTDQEYIELLRAQLANASV
jgi:hypothetical protein